MIVDETNEIYAKDWMYWFERVGKEVKVASAVHNTLDRTLYESVGLHYGLAAELLAKTLWVKKNPTNVVNAKNEVSSQLRVHDTRGLLTQCGVILSDDEDIVLSMLEYSVVPGKYPATKKVTVNTKFVVFTMDDGWQLTCIPQLFFTRIIETQGDWFFRVYVELMNRVILMIDTPTTFGSLHLFYGKNTVNGCPQLQMIRS